MLWHKTWIETRWRFWIGLAVLICSACSTVMIYPQMLRLLGMVPSLNMGGEIGRRIKESVELSREYHSYVWSQWFSHNLVQLWTLFAVLLGTGGLMSQTSGGGALFTLSMPVSRTRLLAVRAGTGLAELLVLAFVPSILIPLISPSIGESYGFGNVLVYGACLFIAGTAFFSLAFLLSTMFTDLWRPLLFALGIAMVMGLVDQVVHNPSFYSVFNVMGAEVYFRHGELPWIGLLVSAAASAAMLYAAAANIARRDF
jgi:ABC-type transport system involved in multi-copper enzyme maturation permease subunit